MIQKKAANSQLAFVPTGVLLPSLQHLLNVRRVIGLRNPAHSLVKLMLPVAGPAVLVTSYTHPEYLHNMSATLSQVGTTALLLRGTEGEAVADARRCPAMDTIWQGHIQRVQDVQAGSLAQMPHLPPPEAEATAAWIRRVLAGDIPVPPPIATQVQHIIALAERLAHTTPANATSATPAIESTP
jgi:anthranilate phosphoribosyltransferase